MWDKTKSIEKGAAAITNTVVSAGGGGASGLLVWILLQLLPDLPNKEEVALSIAGTITLVISFFMEYFKNKRKHTNG